MKIKTTKLLGAQLDAAVALADGYTLCKIHGRGATSFGGVTTALPNGGHQSFILYNGATKAMIERCEDSPFYDNQRFWHPSTNWALGGPIIEREKICIDIRHTGVWLAYTKQNYDDAPKFMHSGPTALITAMRCFIASKLGYVIELPDALA